MALGLRVALEGGEMNLSFPEFRLYGFSLELFLPKSCCQQVARETGDLGLLAPALH